MNELKRILIPVHRNYTLYFDYELYKREGSLKIQNPVHRVTDLDSEMDTMVCRLVVLYE